MPSAHTFFEFLDEREKAHRVHELQLGKIYEVVVTTAGGISRYRLGDRVQVTGYIEQTPSLRFLGRSGNVSDLFGEKLTEAFVTESLREALGHVKKKPDFILLAPDQSALASSYTVYVEGELPSSFTNHFDQVLRQNPHYAYCQDLGQLLPLRMFAIANQGYERFLERQTMGGARIGNVKPLLFSPLSGWSEVFDGRYVSGTKNCELGSENHFRAKS